jgi:glyoxylase-like metal-dependent hydrolase (beta-lactamase superfamily II)
MPEVERLVVGPLATNCYILKSEEELAVIDPGGDADMILEKIQEMESQKPEAKSQKPRAKYVINTHGHIDHVAADKDVLDATGAELLIGELDAEMLAHPEASLAAMMGLRFEPLKPARTLAEGDEVVVGKERLRVYDTPGHTPGGITLVGKGYAFTGDTLFVDSIGRVDFPGGSEEEMQNSLGRLQALLSRDTMLYPGHNEPGTMARALLVNPFLGSVWPG